MLGFSHSLVKYQKSHWFATLTRSISDTSATRVKIPHERAFHEVISIFTVRPAFSVCGTWELMTKPILCGGAPIRIPLRGEELYNY